MVSILCRLRARVCQHNLVVASYDIVRKDIDFFSSIRWNYCILDEGHVIKNGKTKVSSVFLFNQFEGCNVKVMIQFTDKIKGYEIHFIAYLKHKGFTCLNG